MLKLVFVLCTFCIALQAKERVIDLNKFEKTIFSQSGDDGIIDTVFKIVGTSSKYYVEFGGHDGILCSNTRYLRERKGWNGLMMDAGFENPAINLQREFINAENINDLFRKYNVPYDLDLLSIDIDSNDFYVWQALDDLYQPRLVVMEYNSDHLPHEDKVVVYDAQRYWDRTNYFGAGIRAYYNLARKKGYSLVYANRAGINLFFIRDDLVEKAKLNGLIFKNINDVEKIYRHRWSHAKDPLNRPYVKSVDLLQE